MNHQISKLWLQSTLSYKIRGFMNLNTVIFMFSIWISQTSSKSILKPMALVILLFLWQLILRYYTWSLLIAKVLSTFIIIYYASRPLSQCYLRSYLVKNTAGAHKEINKKYKSNLRTLKSKSCEQCRTKHEYCMSIKHFSHFNDLLTAELPCSADPIKVLNMSKT